MTKRNIQNTKIISLAKEIFNIELKEINRARDRLDNNFVEAIELILNRRGRVILIGMGKSGIIGKKIAATLSSTGTSSFFVHPAEAFHGDLGMINKEDIVILISYSGETEEMLKIIPFLRHQKNRIIAITSNPSSSLAKISDSHLDISVKREACNNNLAPTSSTSVTLVMGDAIAVTLAQLTNFQPEDFAKYHPGGNLGKRLLGKVSDYMTNSSLPIVYPSTLFRDILGAITKGRLGVALVLDDKKCIGIITDGDIRRAFECFKNIAEASAQDIMTPNPFTIHQEERILDAENLMIQNKISCLVVTNTKGSVVGVLQIFD